jgi:hypothetical protein
MTTLANNRVNLLTTAVNLPSNIWGIYNDLSLTRLDRWLEAAQGLVNENYEKNFPNLVPSVLEMSDGRRYIRIDQISNGGAGQRSVWAFIDKKTGDILKPAGYKAPAKHARGNLFDTFGGLKYVTAYGPAYLR